MRYLSRIFQPLIVAPPGATIKHNDITCTSQKLLVECGLIRPTSAGLFTILPLARRALHKLELLIRSSIESAGGQSVTLPSMIPAALWRKSGRLETCKSELLQLTDRHSKRYILAPTHEETIADLLSEVSPLSYKQLPLLLYQVTDKYRDEARPKHGLLRARQFTMMDAYGVHADEECVRRSYEAVGCGYERLFGRLGLQVTRVSAPVGDMGGSVSHEWHIVTAAGEDQLATCQNCHSSAVPDGATQCQCGGPLTLENSIEVGHTFILDTKYSEPLNAHFTTSTGEAAPVLMSCYGIGVSRLLAAGLEKMSDKQLRWPRGTAPFSVAVIGPKEGSKEWSAGGWEMTMKLGEELTKLNVLRDDVLLDDRHNMTIGKRLMQADKMGYPVTIVCGKSALQPPPLYEVYFCETSTAPVLLTLSEIMAKLMETREIDRELLTTNVSIL